MATVVQCCTSNPRHILYEGLRAPRSCASTRISSQNSTRRRYSTLQSVLVRASGAKLPLLSFEGERTGSVVLDLKVASAHTAKGLVHRGVVTELQNRRRGTASTKTRGEVRGGGRKPYKQKGTGRARRGSQRTPLRPGGGIIFGPRPRDWSIKINKKEKRLAISTAIQSAAVDSIAVEDFEEKFPAPRTKDFLAALERWGIDKSKHSLIFTTNVTENLTKSHRNVKTVKMLTPRSLNLYDVLRADKLVFTSSGIDYLNERYGVSAATLEDDEEDEDEDVDDLEEEDEGEEGEEGEEDGDGEDEGGAEGEEESV